MRHNFLALDIFFHPVYSRTAFLPIHLPITNISTATYATAVSMFPPLIPISPP